MATPAEYQIEINRLDGLISSKIAEATNLRISGADWIKDGKDDLIRPLHKNKDYQERQRKISLGESYIAMAGQIDNEVLELQSMRTGQMKLKSEAEASSKQVAQTLANQGLTFESSLRQVESQGEALKIKAAGDAQATVVNAEADSSNKKKVGLIIAGIGLVIIITVSVILYKKIKKKA